MITLYEKVTYDYCNTMLELCQLEMNLALRMNIGTLTCWVV